MKLYITFQPDDGPTEELIMPGAIEGDEAIFAEAMAGDPGRVLTASIQISPDDPVRPRLLRAGRIVDVRREGNRARTYTHPDVLTAGITQGWADRETDPSRIDWAPRQAAAAISFEVARGRPVNPAAQTSVRYGRNELGRWGENLMADALVTATYLCLRYVLLVERGDGYGWAVPGGSVEPGETGPAAALRELAEETSVAVPGHLAQALAPRYVPDPRASDEAWAVTLPVHIDLGAVPGLPWVAGGDDARRAEWIRAGSFADLEATLSDAYGGAVFAAHRDMLREFLGGES